MILFLSTKGFSILDCFLRNRQEYSFCPRIGIYFLFSRKACLTSSSCTDHRFPFFETSCLLVYDVFARLAFKAPNQRRHHKRCCDQKVIVDIRCFISTRTKTCRNLWEAGARKRRSVLSAWTQKAGNLGRWTWTADGLSHRYESVIYT